MVSRLIMLFALLFNSTVYAESDKSSVPKETPKEEKKVDNPNVHAPLSTYFLDRRPYMAPKKK